MNDATVPSMPTSAEAQRLSQRVISAVDAVLTGHQTMVQLTLACVLARGHVLIEDVPGVGKTTLARAVARALGGAFARIQFTADMLPGDVLGLQVFDTATQTLSFRPGPLFAEVILADEINRASPKTQSAMLEAMAERAVTIEAHSHPLPETFCVLATQNPSEQHGAYPLPESQLDRFMVCLALGYPPASSELALLTDPDAPSRRLAHTQPQLTQQTLVALQTRVRHVQIHPDVAQYILSLVHATRTHAQIQLGISPRGAIALTQLSRAWAMMAGREYVVPDDVKKLVPFVWAHRLALRHSDAAGQAVGVLAEILERQATPK